MLSPELLSPEETAQLVANIFSRLSSHSTLEHTDVKNFKSRNNGQEFETF